MRGVYLQKQSPFYWVRYYDKYEQDPRKKRKSIGTKIEVTAADRKRAELKKPLIGTDKLRSLVSSFRNGLAARDIERKSGVKFHSDLILSEGFKEFSTIRTVPGSKKQIKKKTLINYEIAVNHMIKACSDKKIHKYSSKDFIDLLNYFEAIKIPGKKITHENGEIEILYKSMSQNSRSIYTRSLRSLWAYFCDKNYAARNIIEAVEAEEKDPAPIPLDEMFSIISYLESDKNYPHHYQLIYFMLLTGCRPSSAMVQLKENIDFKRKFITIQNVKTGKNKKKEFYKYPLYKELEELIKGMGVLAEDSGRLFDMFALNDLHYTAPLSFWDRVIKVLKNSKQVREYYTLKQIRPTTASFLINVLEMQVLTVKRLLDHTDMKITDKHYIELDLGKVRKEMDQIKLNDFIDPENSKSL